MSKFRRTCDKSRPVGEAHWNAVLTDHEALLLIAMRKDGQTYTWLAEKFEVSRSCCFDICNGRRRAVVTGVRRKKRRW
jgi:hypothetical protein